MDGIFDTHCHFDETDDIAAILRRARTAGVTRVLAVGGSDGLNRAAAKAAASRGDDLPEVLLALGHDRDQADVADLPAIPEDAPLAAWGEIGLDYHYSPESRARQIALFLRELAQARRRGLPVVVHTREADEDTLAAFAEIPSRGIIHSFAGSIAFARRLLDLGFYLSISGIVTFKSAAEVREMAKFVPGDRLLVETDAPYLAPVPMRGRANEPAFVVHTCRFLAELRGTDAERLAAQTTRNALTALGGR